ncbi:sporulation protein [Pseudoxanthomonas broegbernensis]|uniref:Sporulation protein n=1 Tax=Pseudoxanthomonas broegbernensis TaxID=83619 RepID=A0A7V8K7V5_9GAMM|nr:SPOR domain-containing protein [Pseudoxanthomonas broegbernensis]KAF1687018.1 sporulation protein [Pseudoxanthomonas broegbernensis]MBB6065366.1 cell division protein FtsN [Pseudoxanthomonas broegbernensis]
MAARRGRSQARRNGNGGRPAWIWLVAGLAIGAVVFLAVPGLFKGGSGDGFVRFGPRANPDAQPAPIADSEAIAETPAADAPAPAVPQYDFYTVLPGNEVRMSDAELAASAREEQARREQAEARRARDALEGRTGTAPAPADAGTGTAAAVQAGAAAVAATPSATAAASTDGARYILQAGAFGASGDAEQVKARIALLGLSARVESGQADGRAVYRVRMGPYGTASELAEAKRKLADGGLQAMAIRAQ